MSGHIFILSQSKITSNTLGTKTVGETKKILLSAKQWEAGADEIKENDLIFCVSGKANSFLTLWLTAKADMKSVKEGQGGYVRLKFVKLKTQQQSYILVDGLSAGQSLKDVGWKRLNDQELLACCFDTKLYAEVVTDPKSNVSFRSKLSRAIPKGLGLDAGTIMQSVLLNGSSDALPTLRNKYDLEILVNEPRYREVLKQRLESLDGRAFEDLLREFFRHAAFKFDDVRTTSKTHDAGIDLFLTRHDDMFGSLLIVGQCKRQMQTVSAKDVQALATVRSQAKAGRAIFITTSKFSLSAKDVAAQDGHIELIDGDKLAELFFQNAEKVPGLWGLIRHAVQLTTF